MQERFPGDFGPLYAETIGGRFPVEPWNTFSNLIFLIIVIRFCYLTRMSYKNHPLIVASLPILFLGFLGGTVYHATRSHNVWLLLDFIPIALLVLLAATSLWSRVLKVNFIFSVLAIFATVFGLRQMTSLLEVERTLAISLNYVVLAFILLSPAIIHCLQRARRGLIWILLATVFFLIAVTARVLDTNPLLLAFLPMGSHFIWHLFGGLSVMFLMEYLYRHLSADPVPQTSSIH